MNWLWPRRRVREPDLKAEAAEERAEALEERADVAEKALRDYLRFRRDPWAGPVLTTIYRRGRDAG